MLCRHTHATLLSAGAADAHKVDNKGLPNRKKERVRPRAAAEAVQKSRMSRR